MTATTDALRVLLEAVKVGRLPEPIFHGSSSIRGHWAYVTGLNEEQRRWVFRAYNGSLDAAKALFDALLPGWIFDITNDSAFIMPSLEVEALQYPGQDKDPARAWLIAILEALIAKDTAND